MGKIPSPRTTPAREEIYIYIHPRRLNHTQILPSPFPFSSGQFSQIRAFRTGLNHLPRALLLLALVALTLLLSPLPRPLSLCQRAGSRSAYTQAHSHKRIPIFGTASPLGNNQILATFPSRPCQDTIAEPSHQHRCRPILWHEQRGLWPGPLRREMDRPSLTAKVTFMHAKHIST